MSSDILDIISMQMLFVFLRRYQLVLCLVVLLWALISTAGLLVLWLELQQRTTSEAELPPRATWGDGQPLPGANLRIGLAVTQDRKPWAGLRIQPHQVQLHCPFSSSVGPPTPLPPWRESWCGAVPLNTDIVTDERGFVDLWYKVDPPPHQAGVTASSYPDIVMPDVLARDDDFLAPDDWHVNLVFPAPCADVIAQCNAGIGW